MRSTTLLLLASVAVLASVAGAADAPPAAPAPPAVTFTAKHRRWQKNKTDTTAAPSSSSAAAAAAAVYAALGAGKIGELCDKGAACSTGICVAGKCISREAACKASAALPLSNCIGNATTGPFAKIQCGDATDAVATNLKLAAGLGSTINSTECYAAGQAYCVVLQDSAALVHYGAQCNPQMSGAGANAAAAAASVLAAFFAALMAAFIL